MSFRKIFSMAALSVVAISSSAQASVYLGTAASIKAKAPANQVSIQPLNLGLGEVILDFERKLNEHVSLVASPMLGAGFGYDLEEKKFSSSRSRALGGDLSLRIWPVGNALQGFYLEPHAGYYHKFASNSLSGGDVATGGARVGWQWIVGKHAVLSLAGGATYYHGFSKTKINLPFGNENIKPDVRFGAGFAF